MRNSKASGFRSYALASILLAAASGDLIRSAIDAPPRPVKPPRKQQLRGPVIDTTKETKREKRRRLRGV